MTIMLGQTKQVIITIFIRFNSITFIHSLCQDFVDHYFPKFLPPIVLSLVSSSLFTFSLEVNVLELWNLETI